MRIALGQINLCVGDIHGNVRKVTEAICTARDDLKANLIAFPELTLSGYPPEDLLLRRDFAQAVAQGLAQVKQTSRSIDVLVGLPEYTASHCYNAVVWLRDQQQIACYRKQKIPNYGVFDERRYFSSGKRSCVVAVEGFRIGVVLCEDVWFPEPAFQARRMGAELLIALNASPFHLGKQDERERIAREHLTPLKLPLAYLNLVGGQDDLVFDGNSFVMDEAGGIVGRAPAFAEKIYLLELEKKGETIHIACAESAIPGGSIAEVYQAVVLAIRDYVHKNGCQGVVIGLSGGIDSALTLALAVDALGADRVEVLLMPSRFTAEISILDAKEEAVALGVDYHILPIDPHFDLLLKSLQVPLPQLTCGITTENLQARCRGILLMAFANEKRRIVLTTGNKSELAVGYTTLYGDMVGGFAPLKDLSKVLVYQLARYRNQQSEVIPERVLQRPPSAELAPEQKDSDTLPPYPVLDAILHRYVEQDQSIQEIIAQGYDESLVRQVARWVKYNEYKRRQSPPGPKITSRAFGRERRYPLTSGFSS